MTLVVYWSVFILVQSIMYHSVQSCDITFSNNNWFGDKCQYKCHCKNNAACDVTNGDCPNGCDTGWFGPACQYADIALNATITVANGASQSTSKIIDGDDSSCASITGSNFSLDVNWNSVFYFTWLRIIVRNIELQTESLSIRFPDDVTPECSNVFVDDITMDIYCNIIKPIKKILLNGSAVSTLCSLYISQGRNVALMQSTNQTSQFEYGNLNSSKAVDGSYSWQRNSCTHTTNGGEPAPTWSLHFNAMVSVTRFKIVNRVGAEHDYDPSCCLDRLKGFVLRTFDQTNNIVQNYTDTEISALEVYNVLSTNTSSPVSTVQITATYHYNYIDQKSILTLCEVEIYGDSLCLQNKYGRDCENVCNCGLDGEKCFVSTGNCPSGCRAGYYRQGCTKHCDAGYFGVDCRNKCNSSCSSQQCEVVDGNCTSCALNGKKLPACTEDCDPGFYGSECKSNCSPNCSQTGSICDVLEGKCFGCKPGLYGSYCTTPCSSNCKDSVCDINSGTCKSCKAGSYGTMCTNVCSKNCKEAECEINSGNCTSCTSGFYGANCTTSCPTNCKDSVCDINYGICISCKDGFKGDNCDEVLSDTSNKGDDNQKTVIGAVVGSICGLVALLVIGTVFFFWRRHKGSDHRSRRQNTNVDNPVIEADSKDHVTSSPKLKIENKLSVKPKVPQKPKAMTVENKQIPEEKGTGYYNTVTLQPVTSSTVIALSNLQSYLLTHSKEYLHEQFKNLPVNIEATMMVGLSAENKHKNRYKNICAYDHSRVHLEADSTKMQGDYINASYLKGYKEEEKFIASQGPNKIILNDFIRMIWEQKVEKVVMLTNLFEDGKSKCDPYWPDECETTFGEIRVRLAATQVFADYIIRRLQLYMDSHPMHPVTHFHFTSWPDKGVPENPWALVDFEQRVAATATKRPIVVHCSAGVGRTGTFIALRNVMREAEDTQQMDCFNTVAKLRQDRTMMIQTAEQYVFLHEAAKVAMTCINTTITANNITDRVRQLEKKSMSGKTEMEIEFDAICSVCMEDSQFTDEERSAGIMYQNSRTVSNKLKNRFGNILPKDICRPVLMCESSDMGDYINAVLTPSFRNRNQDIITQLPLPRTVVDFWRLITQMKISLVVAFDEQLQDTDSTIGVYLPTSEQENASFPPFQVSIGTCNQGSDWEERKLTVTGSKNGEEHCLIHLRYTQHATDPKKLLTFIKHTRKSIPEQEARILYMCRNGATYSGLACVLTLLLDRMDNDQRLTVPLVVGAIKTIRPQVIPTVEQYKILYHVLQRYNETNSVYFNFNDPKLSVPSNDDGKDNLGNVGTTEYANAKF